MYTSHPAAATLAYHGYQPATHTPGTYYHPTTGYTVVLTAKGWYAPGMSRHAPGAAGTQGTTLPTLCLYLAATTPHAA